MKYPFIYIASVMRTGSTILQEMLTQSPNSIILHEPRCYGSKFKLQEYHRKVFLQYNSNIIKTLENKHTINLKELDKLLLKYVQQWGVKEIRNAGWKNYLGVFPNCKIILTGRDPRDIYISCYNVLQRGKQWKPKFGRFNPTNLYREIMPEFNKQQRLSERKKVLKIKYEDLCSKENIFPLVCGFVKSPLKETGKIGAFHKVIKIGKYDLKLHKKELTKKMINRWEKEPNKILLQKANRFYSLMKDYRNFWGYE